MMSSSPEILAVGNALPENYVSQEELTEMLRRVWVTQHFNPSRVADLHKSVKVAGRYLALPMAEYERLESFQEHNDAWSRVSLEIGEKAARSALAKAGLTPKDVDHIFFVTVTGIAVPSLDARLVNRLGLRPDVKRTPIFGLGCVAGAAGIARASDYVRAFPSEVALLVSTELCSLTLQRGDLSVANMIASGLFGDGAAAVVIGGGERRRTAGPGSPVRAPAPSPAIEVIATRSVFYPETERLMGWDVVDSGFKIVLSAAVPDLVHQRIGADVDAFLQSQGLTRTDITHFLAHTGGPKVLKAFAEALDLPEGALQRSWDSLEHTGNLSSASVLFVLNELLESKEAKPGDLGLMIAMGPGFCSELVLLRW
jgi:alkylresorcinol/alkylpyrone synthase